MLSTLKLLGGLVVNESDLADVIGATQLSLDTLRLEVEQHKKTRDVFT